MNNEHQSTRALNRGATLMARYALLTGASLLAPALATPAGAAPESLQVSNGTEKTIEKAQADDLFTFKISSKPLPQAIAEFSAVTGLQVLYTEPAVFERTSPALYVFRIGHRRVARQGRQWRRHDHEPRDRRGPG